jgi:acyl-CoA reductase-like NAD-dependent aldehyde dehydrogenase
MAKGGPLTGQTVHVRSGGSDNADLSTVDVDCLVGDEWVGSTQRTPIVNPGNLTETVGSAPILDAAAVDRAVTAAAAAQVTWSRVPATERAGLVLAATDSFIQLAGLPELLTREQGKPLAEAQIEVSQHADFAAYFAGKAAALDSGESRPTENADLRVYSAPVGVIAIITPFNWPVALTFTKVIPALIAGNAVVIKPAPTTPLAVITAVRALAAGLPPGLVSVVTGGVDVPQALTTHPLVRAVSFTGSTRTGGAVAAAATSGIKNVTLELGGNDPAILLDDVVLGPKLFQALVQSAFISSGQVCFALKRLYVPSRIVGDVVDGLGAVLQEFRVGYGLDPSVTMGPVHNQAQYDTVRNMLAEAEATGGAVQYFGTLTVDPGSGYFLRPALVTGADDGAQIVAEERFGPTLPVIGYDTVESAVARANDSEYGLTASVWSPDIERATGVAKRLQAGLRCVNAHGRSGTLDSPFGGVKRSGIGRERSGVESLDAYTDQQVLSVPRVPSLYDDAG